ncbi:MAG: hypothetical protein R6T87_03030 [Marinobacter sp.]
MYDASVSLQGFSRALAITGHALLNDGEIRKKGNRLEGGRLLISPPRRGSFEELITFVITNKDAIGASIAAAAFYDLMKWTWSKTLDLAYEPQTPHVRKLEERIEPFIGEIEEALESPLEQAHRPIRQNREMVVSIKRARAGEIIQLNNDTLASVSLHTDSDVVRISGNVTRYNILSGFGRLYDDTLDRTISFKVLDDVSTVQKQLLTWSMHYAQAEQGGKVFFDVQRVISAKGNIRRHLVHGISQIQS